MRRFLNRLLGLPIARQNLLFQYFAASLHAAIRRAKAEGRYSEGMSDLPSSNISRDGPPTTLWVDPHSHLRTLRHTLRIDRGVSFEEAQRQLVLQGDAAASNGSGFYVSQRDIFGRRLVLLATAKPGGGLFTVCRPNTGARRCCSCRCLPRGRLRRRRHPAAVPMRSLNRHTLTCRTPPPAEARMHGPARWWVPLQGMRRQRRYHSHAWAAVQGSPSLTWTAPS